MLFADFCKGIYPSCPGYKTHQGFVDALFKAAGKELYISDSYKRNLFNGDKEFIDKLKREFQGLENEKTLEEFFADTIADAKILDILLAFGIPEKHEPNKIALSTALAIQLRAIIDSDVDNAPDVINAAYQEAKKNPLGKDPSAILFAPLYPGDDVYVNSGASYKIGSYENVEHIWLITNTGKIKWIGRKMVYRRGPKDRPEATPSELVIPDVAPHETIKIATTFDGRGFDGVFHCIWEMQDSDGENCFPGRDSLFSVTVDVKFQRM